jgi:hypothetical protein
LAGFSFGGSRGFDTQRGTVSISGKQSREADKHLHMWKRAHINAFAPSDIALQSARQKSISGKIAAKDFSLSLFLIRQGARRSLLTRLGCDRLCGLLNADHLTFRLSTFKINKARLRAA